MTKIIDYTDPNYINPHYANDISNLLKIDYSEALIYLRMFYLKQLEVLEELLERFDLPLFEHYLMLEETVRELIKHKHLNFLVKELPKPIADQWDFFKLQECWPVKKEELYMFVKKIDKLLYSPGVKSFEISSKVKKLLGNMDYSLYQNKLRSGDNTLQRDTYLLPGNNLVSEETIDPDKKTSFRSNGNLIHDNNIILNVTPATQPFYFLEILYCNFGNPVSHEDIYQGCCKKAAKVQDLPEKEEHIFLELNFCSDLNRKVKAKAETAYKKELFEKIVVPTKTPLGKPAFRMKDLD